MFALIPAMLGLASQLVPSIVGLLAGDKASDVTSQVIQVAQAVTGTSTQEDAHAALKADPEKLAAFQAQLAQIALDTTKAADADRNSARQMQMATHDRVPAALAGAVTTGFFGLLGTMLFHGVPPADAQVLNILLGSLGTGWTMILSYYFGASGPNTSAASLGGGARGPLGK